MIHAVGILIGNKTKKKKRLFFGGLQGSRITKMGLLVFISDKNKKREKKVRAASFGLTQLVHKSSYTKHTSHWKV